MFVFFNLNPFGVQECCHLYKREAWHIRDTVIIAWKYASGRTMPTQLVKGTVRDACEVCAPNLHVPLKNYWFEI